MEVVRPFETALKKPTIARGIAAIGIFCILLSAVSKFSSDEPVSMEQDSFYDLAQAALARDSSPVDGLALSRSQALAEVPNEDDLLAIPSLASLSSHGSRTQELHSNDPSSTGYTAFDDLLKKAVLKEKAKHITFEQEIQSMLRKVPEHRKMHQQQEQQRSVARKQADKDALRRLEGHLSRHVAGIVTPGHEYDDKEAKKRERRNEVADEQAVRTEERQRELRHSALRKEEEQRAHQADEKARERMERHIDDNVGSILSTVLSTSSPPASKAIKPSAAAAKVQTPKTEVDPHTLVKEVKKYIDSEIRKEVHDTHQQTDTNAQAELATVRTDLMKGDFEDALKLVNPTRSALRPSMQTKAATGAKLSAQAAATQRTLEKFQHLFGQMQN